MNLQRSLSRLVPLLVSTRHFSHVAPTTTTQRNRLIDFPLTPSVNTITRMPRRSARIRALHTSSSDNVDGLGLSVNSDPVIPTKKKRKRSTSSTKAASPKSKKSDGSSAACLPRMSELNIKSKHVHLKYVIGIDEAGRGPLAGPVVAAAVIAPFDIEGVVDSKKITKEEERERIYEGLIKMDGIRWAVSIINAARIDEINILQATLEGMRTAATALINPSLLAHPSVAAACVEQNGCYVVCSSATVEDTMTTASNGNPDDCPYYALIDGNKIPRDMPCDCEPIVKGDSKEFSIAAASILAKVTRDRLMHAYDALYPEYNLKQHKGYPTAAHMKAVLEVGASPIHRRTFAPLKHMEFDALGKILKNKR